MSYNPGQNTGNKIGKSSNTGQDKMFPISLNSFSNWWGNSYTKFAILDITFTFTCG